MHYKKPPPPPTVKYYSVKTGRQSMYIWNKNTTTAKNNIDNKIKQGYVFLKKEVNSITSARK